MYDKSEDNNIIYKIEFFLKKTSHTMIGIQIHLEYNWRKKWRHFRIKQDFQISHV